jgi:hypothetical protein
MRVLATIGLLLFVGCGGNHFASPKLSDSTTLDTATNVANATTLPSSATTVPPTTTTANLSYQAGSQRTQVLVPSGWALDTRLSLPNFASWSNPGDSFEAVSIQVWVGQAPSNWLSVSGPFGGSLTLLNGSQWSWTQNMVPGYGCQPCSTNGIDVISRTADGTKVYQTVIVLVRDSQHAIATTILNDYLRRTKT